MGEAQEVLACFDLCRTLGWSWNDLMNTPIDTVHDFLAIMELERYGQQPSTNHHRRPE